MRIIGYCDENNIEVCICKAIIVYSYEEIDWRIGDWSYDADLGFIVCPNCKHRILVKIRQNKSYLEDL